MSDSLNDRNDSPGAVYRGRLDERRATAAACRAIESRISLVRLAIFLVGVAVVWFAFKASLGWGWIAVPVALFPLALAWHDRVTRRRQQAEHAVGFYEAGLARLDDRWAGQGNPGDALGDPQHLHAADLDLFGSGSLFELLCVARTRSGERTLAAWLKNSADPAEVRLRQEAVRELRDDLDLREALAVAGAGGGAIDPDAVVAWSREPRRLTAGWVPRVAVVLALANSVALAYWAWFALRPEAPPGAHHLPILLSLTAGALFGLSWRTHVLGVMSGIDRPAEDLRRLASILQRFEGLRFRSTRLSALGRELEQDGSPASRRVARLARWIELWDSRENKLFAPLAAMLFLGTQLAFAVERWRAGSGQQVERWVSALGQIEALSSLAGFAYERPENPFPELVEQGPRFEAEQAGHPLLPASVCVRNDVELNPDRRLLLVSGSNMSGKSTLLRTVGVNTVLALAGAPVCATRLRLSPLEVGASMRVVDSLQQGTSHFYAEIKRLRAIVDRAAGPRPVLFLLDEILHGTHSDDRRVGAEALIRGLLGQGAIGLVTTHDLALARIADGLAPRAANVHFEDRLQGGRVTFDYRLRRGVVQRSNALELMRAVGLNV